METSPLICSANQCTDFYIITASVMKGLNCLSFYLEVTLQTLNNVFGKCRTDSTV